MKCQKKVCTRESAVSFCRRANLIYIHSHASPLCSPSVRRSLLIIKGFLIRPLQCILFAVVHLLCLFI